MRARQLGKRIELWTSKTLKDGAGGSTTYGQLVSSSWANIETVKATASKLNPIGLNDLSEKLIVTVRFRQDLPYNGTNQYIMYRGVRYSFTMKPIDIDFSSSFVKLIATREVVNTAVILEPINADANTIYINYKSRIEVNQGTLSSDQCTKEYINELL